MKPETLIALQGSIRKWEQIAAGKGEDKGVLNCPLCQEFFYKRGCRGCPVSAKTGHHNCNRTPYTEWEEQLRDEVVDGRRGVHVRRATTPALVALAQKEVEFLRSLLPE